MSLCYNINITFLFYCMRMCQYMHHNNQTPVQRCQDPFINPEREDEDVELLTWLLLSCS